jgi:hypothetical protein
MIRVRPYVSDFSGTGLKRKSQCCAPPPNAATPRDFQTPPPPGISVGVERREIWLR